jgi:hypothetical protein
MAYHRFPMMSRIAIKASHLPSSMKLSGWHDSSKNNPAKQCFAGHRHQLIIFMTLAASLGVLLTGTTAGGRPLVTALVLVALATSFCMLFIRASTGTVLI